jgi:hypothetical protein
LQGTIMIRTTQGRSTLRGKWLEALKAELDPKQGIPAIIKKRDALSSWSELRSAPSGRTETELTYALQIAIGDYEHPLVQKCLRRALEVTSAGENDERWYTWWAASRQVEHGRFLSAGQLANAWLLNDEVDRARFMNASEELLRGAREDRPVWTEMAQSEYVHGIQLLLIAGEVSEAVGRLTIDAKFNRVQRLYNWHVRLLELLGNHTCNQTALEAHFDPYFNELRDPFFRAPANDLNGNNLPGLALLRLRLALIRWLYIERQPIAGNWRHIIGQIGY